MNSVLPPLHGDGTEIEEHERVIGPLGQFGIEDLSVALELSRPQRRVGVANVSDGHISPSNKYLRLTQRRQDLLVHRVRPRSPKTKNQA
jgi:hypothetical protein